MRGIRGITLVTLVITIIILLILAGITVMQLSENGIFGKAKLAKERTEYTSAKEIIEMKLMEVLTDCVYEGKEYTITEIAESMKEDKKITIEKYYNGNIALIKEDIQENLIDLQGIVVSVNDYSKYKFLIGKGREIDGVMTNEIKDTTEKDEFIPLKEFEKNIFGNKDEETDDVITGEEEKVTIKVPAIQEGTDITGDIKVQTFISIKYNTENNIEIDGVESAKYEVLKQTKDVVMKEGKIIAGRNANSKDECIIKIIGIYDGKNYENTLTAYVEPINITTVEDKDGNIKEAFGIYTAQDLRRLAQLVNNSVDTIYNAKVMNNIDLSSICGSEKGSWETIGWQINWDKPGVIYVGIFDGNYKTIDGLYIKELEKNGLGLIGSCENSEIKNVIIGKNSYIEGKGINAAIVGQCKNTIIENCGNNGEIRGYDETVTGGIVGYAFNSSIIRSCYNKGKVTGEVCVGGIAGNSNTTQIYNCYNEGEIYGYSDMGGIVGYIDRSSTKEDDSVKYSYNCGTITVSNEYWVSNPTKEASTGGIVGQMYNGGVIQNCYNLGKILGNDKPNNGGICGHLSGIANEIIYVKNSYNKADIETKATKTGGICGYIRNQYIRVENSYIQNNIKVKSNDIDASKLYGTANDYLGRLVGHPYSTSATYLSNVGELEQTEMPEIYSVINENSEGDSEYWVRTTGNPILIWEQNVK